MFEGLLNAKSTDPLAEIDQVRGKVKAGPVARRAQDGFDHRRDGTLALGPRDVDDRIRFMRIPEVPQHGLHPSEIERVRGILVCALEAVVDEGVQIIQCLLVGIFFHAGDCTRSGLR